MSNSSKKIVLTSCDSESFEVEEAVAVQSQTIKHMIEDNCADSGIPLPNVTGRILAMVVEYCKRHAENPGQPSADHKDELKKFNSEFVKVDQDTIFDLMLAANYLEVKSLLDLTCQTVADMIKDKTVEQIRVIFHITNDFTPEEEQEVRRENVWAFE